MKVTFASCVMAGAMLFAAASLNCAQAESPWAKITGVGLFKRVPSDPQSLFPLTSDNGPWVIIAMTFSGDNAEEQARELVHELRTRHKMKAYTYRAEFDYSKTVVGRGIDEYGQPLKMKYQRNGAFDEIAVLVGDFDSVDDPAAQRARDKLKIIQPDCLDLAKRTREGKKDARSLGGWREMQKLAYEQFNLDQKTKGPMRHAHITTNPLIPDEYFAPKGVDKFVEEMNSEVTYSLLKCPGRYTVKVATFTGAVVIDPEKIAKLEKNEAKMPSGLEQAAKNANDMTKELRKQGVEAYEFHDRHNSIVTIGSFDSVGSPRQDGKIELLPQVLEIMNRYGASQSGAGAGKPKSIAKIPCDIQPIPIEVPRRSIGAQYDRQLLGSR